MIRLGNGIAESRYYFAQPFPQSSQYLAAHLLLLSPVRSILKLPDPREACGDTLILVNEICLFLPLCPGISYARRQRQDNPLVVADHAHTNAAPVEACLASKTPWLINRVVRLLSGSQVSLDTAVIASLATH